MNNTMRRWIRALLFTLVITIFSEIFNMFDEYASRPYYIFPSVDSGYLQHAFWSFLPLITGFCMIPLGYLLGSFIIRFYIKLTKSNSMIQNIGFARIKEDSQIIKKKYLNRILFGILLCVNLWVLFFQYDIFKLTIKPEYHNDMYNANTGAMLNFPMVAWYWLPITITSLVFSICFVILDSGLVFIKKIPEHPEFSDTQRVGDLFWNMIKGYAGVSVILNFILLIITPMGKEASLVLYPFIAFLYLVFVIASMDLLGKWGRNLIFNVVKKERNPIIITLEYKTTEINQSEELNL